MARPITTAGTTLQESDPRRQFTDDEVESGLQKLAITLSPTAAARDLAAELGRPVSVSCIRRWRDHAYVDRYLEIRQEVFPKLRKQMAARHEDAALLALDKEIELIGRIDPEKVSPDQLGNTVSRLAVGGGIHTDKASTLRDLPDTIVKHMDAEENLDEIARLAPGSVVDSTAVEVAVTDAEVVE